MNANQLINMVVRMFVGQIVRRGVNAGIDRVVSGGKGHADMSPEERQQAQQAKRATHQAGRMARMGRRIGRF